MPLVDNKIQVGKRVKCPYYRKWTHMLERCSPKFQTERPSYEGCSVAPRWHSFMAFREWMMSQDWEGKELDKDLLIEGNKVYGPLFCVFVDSKTNTLLADRAAGRGDLPLGVSMNRKRYQAQCRKNGKLIHVGTYDTPEEAQSAYNKFKAEVIGEAAFRQPDERVKAALIVRAANLSPSFQIN